MTICIISYIFVARANSRAEALNAEIVRLKADQEAKLDDLKAKIVSRDKQIAELGEKVQTLTRRVTAKPATPAGEPSSPAIAPPPPPAESRPKPPSPEGSVYFDLSDVDDHLNIRLNPGSSETKVGQIPRGATCIQNLGETRTVANQTWNKINFKGAVGWVHAGFLKPAQKCP